MSSPDNIILLVDDAPQSLGALCSELEADGYTVIVAIDGASALARLELVSPDAILMDALMPGMDGFETCRQIKSDPAWAHVPVIFMTGLTETENVLDGLAAGFVGEGCGEQIGAAAKAIGDAAGRAVRIGGADQPVELVVGEVAPVGGFTAQEGRGLL